MFALINKYKKRKHNSNTLFDGDDTLFKHVLSEVEIYGEYGCGRSTNWVLDNTSAKVLSVDSSNSWVRKVVSNAPPNSQQLNIKHIDLGDVAEWGYPVDYQHGDLFHQDTEWIWQQDDER